MKKFLIVVCVIGVVIFLGYIGKDMDLSGLNSNKTNNTSNSNVVSGKNQTNTSNNTAKNTTDQANNAVNNAATNQTENKTENVTENKTENTVNNTTNTTTTPAATVEQNTVSDEDKAKKLAEQTYGSSDGVYFKIEQVQGNGVYIISVRDAETTGALAWYTIDAKNNTVK